MSSVMSTALSRLNAFLDSELEQILCFDSVNASCEIIEGKLLNGNQTIASIKEWVDALVV